MANIGQHLFLIKISLLCGETPQNDLLPSGKYSQNRELPEAGRTRPALYGLYEVARCTPLFLPRLLPLPRR
ncbi:hypothetical protein FFT49_23800 [Klebsiella pneumoniae]|nr:hypothetical protein FFT49_23800 [Klebsiella pneumoniae]